MSSEVFIGRLAKRAGVSVPAVRFYERRGLLPPPRRSSSGYRIYGTEAADRLRFVKRAQALGFSLHEIREILRLRFDGGSPCACVRELLQARLDRLERHMKELAHFRQDLRRALRLSPSLAHAGSRICPLIEEIVPAGRRIPSRARSERPRTRRE